MTPLEIAQTNGHSELAAMLRDYKVSFNLKILLAYSREIMDNNRSIEALRTKGKFLTKKYFFVTKLNTYYILHAEDSCVPGNTFY